MLNNNKIFVLIVVRVPLPGWIWIWAIVTLFDVKVEIAFIFFVI